MFFRPSRKSPPNGEMPVFFANSHTPRATIQVDEFPIPTSTPSSNRSVNIIQMESIPPNALQPPLIPQSNVLSPQHFIALPPSPSCSTPLPTNPSSDPPQPSPPIYVPLQHSPPNYAPPQPVASTSWNISPPRIPPPSNVDEDDEERDAPLNMHNFTWPGIRQSPTPRPPRDCKKTSSYKSQLSRK
jgi:hypothetical protein